MAFEDDYQSSVLSYPTHAELHDVLMEHFEVLDEKLLYGLPTFIVKWRTDYLPEIEVQKQVFNQVNETAKRLRVWPMVRWRDKANRTYIIRFVPIEKPPPSDIRINYALFIATLGTIALAGFWQATSPIFLTLFYPQGYTIWDILFVTLFFMAALMGIIGTHEAGHYFAAKRRGIDATPPYFIPGLPYIGGTFGAFIQQRSPPMNREDLYDLGVAGPLAGFVVTVAVLIAGFLLSVPVTAQQLAAIEATYPGMSGELGVPYLFILMEYVFADFIPAGGTLYMHPLAFASWIGMLITSLNLFPASQLDGGHASRAVFGSKIHKYVGWIAIAAMFLARFYLMAILVLLLSRGGEHPGPLNDTVEVSMSRKIMFVISMVILALCIPPLWEMFGF